MLSISGLGNTVPDYYFQTPADKTLIAEPSDDGLAIAEGAQQFSLASNSSYMFSELNQSILYSGNFKGVQGAIDSYTQSLPNFHVYDSPYTAPSTKFLNDLEAVKSDASAGNLGAAASDLQKAKYDAPVGISEAYAKHDASGIAGCLTENAATTADYLASQGYTAANAKAEAIALTINGVVDHSQNTIATATTQAGEITDLAISLASNTPSTNALAVPTFGNNFFDVVYNIVNSTASATSRIEAYGLNNRALAAMDALYGSKGTSANGTDISGSTNVNNDGQL
jgi:hypothetical protein